MTKNDLPELAQALDALRDQTDFAIAKIRSYSALAAMGDATLLPASAETKWLTVIGAHAVALQSAYNTAKAIYQR